MMQMDVKTIRSLINKIDSGLEQVKIRSINSLHTKIISNILSSKQLASFIELPAVLMNWINNHQHKSEPLLKVIHILQTLTNAQEGLKLLKQYQSLQFLEGFKKYFILHNSNIQNYQNKLVNIIHKLLPFKSKHNQNQNTMNSEEEQPKILNISQTKSQYIQNIEVKTVKHRTNKKILQFTVPKAELPENAEKYIFDLTVQLKYGNKITQYITIRKIKQFIFEYPTQQHRNKFDLIRDLGDMFQNGSQYSNEISSILTQVLKAHIKQQENLKRWEYKNIKNRGIKTVKEEIVISQGIFRWGLSEPVLQIISENFRQEWIQWMSEIKQEWCCPYLLRMMKNIPKQKLREYKIEIQKILGVLQKKQQLYLQYRWLNQIVDSQLFKTAQQYQLIKSSFQKIVKFQNHKFIPYQHTHVIQKLLQDLKQGALGLAYSPNILYVYIDTLLFLSIAALKQDPLKDYFYQFQNTFINLLKHPTEQVRIKIFQLLLQKAYLQDKIKYFNDQFVIGDITLMLFLDQILWIKMFEESLNNVQSTIYMLQLCKLLYIHHSNIFYFRFLKIGNVLNILSNHRENRIKKLSKSFLQKFERKQLLLCQAMQLFNKDSLVRLEAGVNLVGRRQDFVGLCLQRQNEDQQKQKVLSIEQDSIVNYINIITNNNIQMGIRISAINELIELVQRCQFSNILVNRVQNLNQNVLRWLVKTEDIVFKSYLLNLNLKLYLKNIKCRLFDNIQYLLKQLLQPLNNSYKSKILKIIYLNCFKNPFSNQLKLHSALNSDQYYPFVKLNQTPRIIQNIIPKKINKFQAAQPEVTNFTNLVGMMQFIYKNLEYGRDFEIRFEQIQKLIGKCICTNISESNLSLLRSLFELYKKKEERFKVLSGQFQQLIPLMINSLNTQNSKYFEMDLIKIMRIIEIRNERQINVLINHRNVGVKLQMSEYLSVLNNEALIENLIKQLSTSNENLTKQIYKLLISKQYNHQKLTNQLLQITLISSIQRSIQTPNHVQLKLYALQLLHQIIHIQFLQQHSVFINIILDQILSQSNNYLIFITTLNIAKLFIKFQTPSIFRSFSLIKMPNYILQWLKKDHLPFLLYANLLSLFNNMQKAKMLSNYQVIDTIVDLFNQKFVLSTEQFNNKDQQYLLMIHQICWSLILSANQRSQQLINYILTSTDTLTNILYIMRRIKLICSNSSVKKQQIILSLDSLGYLLFYLSQNQDLFVFHLNKILNLQQFKIQKNIFTYFSDFLKFSGDIYSKMLGRLIIIWYKGHLSLDRNNLGGQILPYFVKLGDQNVLNGLLAVSNSAKNSYIQLGQFDIFLRNSMISLDMIIVQDIKQKKIVWTKNNKASKQDSINVSRTLIKKNQQKKTYQQVTKIAQFLKSFFHKTQNNIQVKITNNGGLVLLIQKIFQYSSARKNSQFLTFKKMLSNLSSNPSFQKQIFFYLIDQKNQFLVELIQMCTKTESWNPLFKNAIDALSIFCSHGEVRALIYRNKLIQQLNSKIIKNWQKTKQWENNLNLINQIIIFYLCLSMHKDSHIKILFDKRILDFFVNIMQQLQLKPFHTNVIMLTTNLAYSKHNKSVFVGNKELHKTILGIVTGTRYMLQLLYNLLYKCSAAIRLYKRKQVIEQMRCIKKQMRQQESETMVRRILQILESDYN